MRSGSLNHAGAQWDISGLEGCLRVRGWLRVSGRGVSVLLVLDSEEIIHKGVSMGFIQVEAPVQYDKGGPQASPVDKNVSFVGGGPCAVAHFDHA